MKRLLAIGLIWLGCAIAWMILGSTILVRTGDTSTALENEVHLLWGPPMVQNPPRAIYRQAKKVTEKVTITDANGSPVQREVEREVMEELDIRLAQSNIDVELDLAHRRKGLLWFPTYGVDFNAGYAFENDTPEARDIELTFPLHYATDSTVRHDGVVGASGVYDGFVITDESGRAINATIRDGVARWKDRFDPGERRTYRVSYRSRGTRQWHYQLTAGTSQVRDFRLTMKTTFANVDFPAGTLSPSRHHTTPDGWEGEWRFESLVAGSPIGIDLPQKLNPGPLASRITFFAPVGLLFFFFVCAVLATAQRRNIHPLNYFFFGCAFFAFHLLFAYLVDHLAIFPAFAVASAVSVLLVLTYARLFVGWRFALREMALSQVIYLVLFSFTFFWEGFTGLSITVGAILTLFVMMQITGRVKWSEVTGEPRTVVPTPS